MEERLRNAFLTVTSRSRHALGTRKRSTTTGNLHRHPHHPPIFSTRRTDLEPCFSAPRDQDRVESNEKYRYSLRSFVPFRLVSRSHAPQRVHKSLVSIKQTRNRGKIATLYNVCIYTRTVLLFQRRWIIRDRRFRFFFFVLEIEELLYNGRQKKEKKEKETRAIPREVDVRFYRTIYFTHR